MTTTRSKVRPRAGMPVGLSLAVAATILGNFASAQRPAPATEETKEDRLARTIVEKADRVRFPPAASRWA